MNYVSIGNLCWSAHEIRKKGLRQVAYPFDWNVTNITSIIKIIENDFVDVMTHLKFLSPIKRILYIENDINDIEYDTDNLMFPVVDIKYNILFCHDFNIDNNKQAIDKYLLRFMRFKNLLENVNEPIIFVYDNDIYDDWQQNIFNECNINNTDQNLDINYFINLIQAKYNRQNFKIINRTML
jgi:hypothetical protein